MPRRKNAYISDGSDSDASGSGGSDGGYNSQEDGDSRAERALFEQKRGNKRQKTNGQSGKDSAWEGIFGEGDDEGPRGGGRGVGSKRGGRGGGSSGRTDWTKPPTFVSKSTLNTEETLPTDEEMKSAIEVEGEHGEEDSGDESDGSDDSSRPPSPRVRGDEDGQDEDSAAAAGLGGGSRMKGFAPPAEEAPAPAVGKRGGIGSALRGGGRGGIGSTSRSFVAAPPLVEESQSASGSSTPRGGLGSGHAPPQSMAATSSTPASSEGPIAFGRQVPSVASSSTSSAPRAQRSFVTRASAPAAPAPTPLTSVEAAHFRKIENDFGAKFLSKLGWAPGKGLGLNEDGRAVPVAAGKVLKGQGISSGVRTEDSKREARRKGEVISDSEEEEAERRKANRRRGKGDAGKKGQSQGEGEQSWKRQKKVKVKVEHKTYEQIVAEASDQAASGVGLVLDARSGELKEVGIAGLSISNWTPTNDDMQLPELRHNLRLVQDSTKADVDALAREGKNVVEKRKWAVREEHLARKRVEDAENRVARLEKVQECVSAISNIAADRPKVGKSNDALEGFNESFTSLLSFKEEYRTMGLDEVVVGAIAQTTKQAFADWDPLDISSDSLLQSLKRWRHAYNLPQSDDNAGQAMVTTAHKTNGAGPVNLERTMTPWESLLWSLWLPRVRSSINNDWSAFHPHSAVVLLESWTPILPPFIRDNILDQLILPKIKKAVEEWSHKPSRSGKVRSLAGVIFPWLPLLGPRMEEVMELAKRRIRSVLRGWTVQEGVPSELAKWRKDMYTSSEWDKLMLQFVVPKLGHSLREDFRIDPSNQKMQPLEEWVLPWHTLLRSSMFVHLLDVELWPAWLEILYIWLASPGCKPDEVASWFTWWKSQFPPAILDIRGVQHAFKQGLELMDTAMRLGSAAPDRLSNPTYKPLPPSKSRHHSSTRRDSPAPTPIRLPTDIPSTDPTEITFRSLAEEAAAAKDLIFLPLGRSHAQTGKPLFRVAKGVDGKGGVTVYIGDNAVFVQGEDGAYKAVTLDDMVKRAGG